MVTDIGLFLALWGTGIAVGASTAPGRAAWRVPPRWLALAIVLNVLLVPAGALLLVRAMGLSEGTTTGIVVFASAAGGAIALATTRMSRGDVQRAVLLVVLLELLDLVAIPVWTRVALPAAATVPVVDVARTLVLLLIVPLLIGAAIRWRRPDAVPRVLSLVGPASLVGLVVAVAAVVWRTGPVVWDLLGTGLPIVTVAIVGGAWAAGYALGGPGLRQRRALAMVTAGRSSALALAVVRAAYPGQPDAEAALVVAGLVALLLPVVIAAVIAAGERSPARTPDGASV